MKLINRSPYNTRVLRAAVTAAMRTNYDGLAPLWWQKLRVYVVLVGTRAPVSGSPGSPGRLGPQFGTVCIRVPKLTGDEWHQIIRDEPNGTALTTEQVASAAMIELIDGRQRNGVFAPDQKYLRKLPKVVPLRIVTPKPKRDAVRERYERVLELERNWMRKVKHAQTRLKTVRKRRRYYEKKHNLKEA
jgi:hypothetical protein